MQMSQMTDDRLKFILKFVEVTGFRQQILDMDIWPG